MAYDDICNCGHQRKEHHLNTYCNATVATKVTEHGFSSTVNTPVDDGCAEFRDKFAVPDSDEPAELNNFLANLRAQIEQMATIMAPLRLDAELAAMELDDIDVKRRAAVAKKAEIAEQMKSFDALVRKAEYAAIQADRKIAQAKAIVEAEEEFKRLADSFDLITAGAFWREWAFDYQVEDAKRMALGKRVIVGNTMGTGKSGTSLITCDMLKAKRVLIFTPATVMRSFVAEVNKWTPGRNVYLMGGLSRAERRVSVSMLQMLKNVDSDFTVILNYESMRKDSSFIIDLKSLEFEVVILDEAHNFKDKKSLTFRQVKEVVNGDGHQPEYVYPMTGSPILNKPQDLWPLLNIIAPYEFSDEYYFLSDYCMKDWSTGKWSFTTTGLNGLQHKLRDKFIRRTKEQTGLKLPEKTLTVHDIDLDPVANSLQHKAYLELRTQAAIWLDDDKAMSVTTALALITRERQMMTLPSGIKWIDNDQKSPTFGDVIFKCDITDSVKLDYIIHANGSDDNPTWNDPGGLSAEIIEEKQVIMSQFKAPLQDLKRRFDLARATDPAYHAEIIDGDTPMERRQEFINDFQDPNGKIRILLGNFKALGVGVTLTAASQMIVLDEEWSPGKNEQAYDRIHRIGQTKAVTIHILRVRDSIDDWMAMLNVEKAGLVDGFNQTIDIAQEYRRRLLGDDK